MQITKLLLWFSIWYTFYLLQDRIFIPRKITFRKNRIGIISLGGVYILLALFAFRINTPLFPLALIFVLLFSVFLLHALFLPLHKTINRFSNSFKFRKVSPILGRFTEIGFQQIMLYVLATDIYSQTKGVIFLSGLTFGLSHLPILTQKRLTLNWRIFVVVTALLGGFALSWIILKIPKGLFWSYLTHLIFYFILGVLTDESDQMLP
jgi:hypothetical protein